MRDRSVKGVKRKEKKKKKKRKKKKEKKVNFFFFKQKTAYELYQCDWSSDVCSSDLLEPDQVVAMPRQKDRAAMRRVLERVAQRDRHGGDVP